MWHTMSGSVADVGMVRTQKLVSSGATLPPAQETTVSVQRRRLVIMLAVGAVPYQGHGG